MIKTLSFLLPLLLAVAGSGCRNRAPLASKAKHVGYTQELPIAGGFESLHKSIGVVLRGGVDTGKDALSQGGLGTGFLVADVSGAYVGMTNRHVWDALCAQQCSIGFQKGETGDWSFYALKPYVETNPQGQKTHVISPKGARPNGMMWGDYAMFTIDKNASEPLTPLNVRWSGAPALAIESVIGYPAGVYSAEHPDPEAPLLVRSRGVIRTMNDGLFIGSAQSRPGNSGSPVFAWQMSSSGKPDFVAIGINFGGFSQIDEQETNSPLSDYLASTKTNWHMGSTFQVVREQFPWLRLWTQVQAQKPDSQLFTAENGSRIISDVKCRYLRSGQEGAQATGHRCTMKVISSVDLKRLFFSGIPVQTLPEFTANAGIVSFLVPKTKFNEFFEIEYDISEQQVAFLECLDQKQLPPQEFKTLVDEYIADPSNPKWKEPRYEAFMKWVASISSSTSDAHFACNLDGTAAIPEYMIRIQLAPHEDHN